MPFSCRSTLLRHAGTTPSRSRPRSPGTYAISALSAIAVARASCRRRRLPTHREMSYSVQRLSALRADVGQRSCRRRRPCRRRWSCRRGRCSRRRSPSCCVRWPVAPSSRPSTRSSPFSTVMVGFSGSLVWALSTSVWNTAPVSSAAAVQPARSWRRPRRSSPSPGPRFGGLRGQGERFGRRIEGGAVREVVASAVGVGLKTSAARGLPRRLSSVRCSRAPLVAR